MRFEVIVTAVSSVQVHVLITGHVIRLMTSTRVRVLRLDASFLHKKTFPRLGEPLTHRLLLQRLVQRSVYDRAILAYRLPRLLLVSQ